MKKWLAVCLSVMILSMVVGCASKNNADPSGEDASTLPLAWGVRYMYSVDEGKFSAYVSGTAIPGSEIGEKIDDVSVTAGLRNNDEMFWLTQETCRCEVYLIDGIPDDVAVALKFMDEADGTTTTHYYVIMNPEADLAAVEAYVVSPYVANLLSRGTDIYPTVMVDGQFYHWKTTLDELPDDSEYYGEITYSFAETPTKNGELMAVFKVSGQIYTVPGEHDRVYLCVTTNWLTEKVVAFDLVKNGNQTD